MEEKSDKSHDQGGRVIFFVDDDVKLHRAVTELLEHRGFEVVGAHSAQEAVTVIESYEGVIDVLLMDINLPDGWGASVAQRLLEVRPEMPVVYTTGYAEEDPVLAGGLNDAEFVVRKPFSTDQLVEVLTRAIGEGAG